MRELTRREKSDINRRAHELAAIEFERIKASLTAAAMEMISEGRAPDVGTLCYEPCKRRIL